MDRAEKDNSFLGEKKPQGHTSSRTESQQSGGAQPGRAVVFMNGCPGTRTGKHGNADEDHEDRYQLLPTERFSRDGIEGNQDH